MLWGRCSVLILTSRWRLGSVSREAAGLHEPAGLRGQSAQRGLGRRSVALRVVNSRQEGEDFTTPVRSGAERRAVTWSPDPTDGADGTAAGPHQEADTGSPVRPPVRSTSPRRRNPPTPKR
ncbi:unnamed protein product [Arctogadus glacialis]